MSLITVQIGQCGNQIGHQLFETLIDDIQHKDQLYVKSASAYKSESHKRFFRDKDEENVSNYSEARAVAVDTEGKVIYNITNLAKKSGKWCFPEGQQFSQKRGAGNNWADGFYRHGPEAETPVLNLLQTELEKCDYFGGFLSLMSIAGGTGSGVGTRLSQVIKDAFPKAFVLNALICPHGAGEVIVQNYNAVLSLAHIYENADAVIVFQNDVVKTIAQNVSENPTKVTFLDMNKVIAHQLGQLLQPSSSKLRSHTTCFGDLLEHLVPHHDYKLLTPCTVPQISEVALSFSTFKWPPLIKRAYQMLITGRTIEEGLSWHNSPATAKNKSLSNLLIIRGKDSDTVDTSAFQKSQLYPSWIPGSTSFQEWIQPQPFRGYEKSCSLLSNCQMPISSLDGVVQKAWDMFAMRAYTHWYTRYGMAEDEFIDCFAKVEQIISNYKSL